MRIFSNPVEAVIEVTRDLWEMGIEVWPKTMQDKYVGDDPSFKTTEVRGYGFQISDWAFNWHDIQEVIKYFFKDTSEASRVFNYVMRELNERLHGEPRNPGTAYLQRPEVWEEFLHDGRFAYTYSERISPQLNDIMHTLTAEEGTRQAVINIHSNICPMSHTTGPAVEPSADLHNLGGHGRVPCSMYYQIMPRGDKIDFVYTMRSCDLLTHFPVDIALALGMQDFFCNQLKREAGLFTYFTGSLHAYYKDIEARGIF